MERSGRRIIHTVKFPKIFGRNRWQTCRNKASSKLRFVLLQLQKTFSIVLLAAVNSNYEFIILDVGVNRRVSDGWAMQHATFWKLLKENSLHISEPENVTNNTRKPSFVFIVRRGICDVRTFIKVIHKSVLNEEQKIFKSLPSRGCRIVENAFGVLSPGFSVFQRKNLSISRQKSPENNICVLLSSQSSNEKEVRHIHSPRPSTRKKRRKGWNYCRWLESELAINDCTVSQGRHISELSKNATDQNCQHFND
jgi:hypothetical protein